MLVLPSCLQQEHAVSAVKASLPCIAPRFVRRVSFLAGPQQFTQGKEKINFLFVLLEGRLTEGRLKVSPLSKSWHYSPLLSSSTKGPLLLTTTLLQDSITGPSSHRQHPPSHRWPPVTSHRWPLPRSRCRHTPPSHQRTGVFTPSSTPRFGQRTPHIRVRPARGAQTR